MACSVALQKWQHTSSQPCLGSEAICGVRCSSAMGGDALTEVALSCLGSDSICSIFFAGKLGRAFPGRKGYAVKTEQQRGREDSLRAFALGRRAL